MALAELIADLTELHQTHGDLLVYASCNRNPLYAGVTGAWLANVDGVAAVEVAFDEQLLPDSHWRLNDR